MATTEIALTNFHLVLPAEKKSQSELLAYTAALHSKSPQEPQFSEEKMQTMLRRFGVKPEQVENRFMESVDFAATSYGMEARMNFFGERAKKIFSEFYPGDATIPAHIVHVSCTGYVSPSPAQHLVNQKHWHGKTNVTHAYHMGCYASMPAVRMAAALVVAGEKNVDIAHTEMCSLHFNPNDHSPEQLVVQSLFADGHIKYTALPKQEAKEGFTILNIRERLIPDSQNSMTWQPADWGMKMSLSREVPEKIASELNNFLEELLEKCGVPFAKILQDAYFAIHPGGPKIIDTIQEKLALQDKQVAASRKVMRGRGNISSATLPHVWNELLEEKIPRGSLVVSLAFGPGLTMFGALFEAL